MGAAYCDVFTCDYLVDRAIGDFRSRFGKRRQLSVRGCGGPVAFVERLAEQITTAG
jgi:hypothetical protein